MWHVYLITRNGETVDLGEFEGRSLAHDAADVIAALLGDRNGVAQVSAVGPDGEPSLVILVSGEATK